jgi:hypothetical protein
MEELTLLSQTLQLVDNWKEIVENLDVRNAIMWCLTHFTYRNANIDANRIRTPSKDQKVVEDLIRIICTESDEKLKEILRKTLESLTNKSLKQKIKEILEINNKFDIGDKINLPRYFDYTYIPIYKKPGGAEDGVICILMINKDNLNISEDPLINRMIQLRMIKNSNVTHETYTTQIAIILADSDYNIEVANDMKTEVIVELISNVVTASIDCIDRELLNKNYLLKAMLTDAIIGNIDSNISNFIIDTNMKIIPIDVDVIFQFDLKYYIQSQSLDVRNRKKYLELPYRTDVPGKLIMIYYYIIGYLNYAELKTLFDTYLKSWNLSGYDFDISEEMFNTTLIEVLQAEKIKLIENVEYNIKNDHNIETKSRDLVLSLCDNIKIIHQAVVIKRSNKLINQENNSTSKFTISNKEQHGRDKIGLSGGI